MSPRTHFFICVLAASMLAFDVYIAGLYGIFSGTLMAVVLFTHLSELIFGRASRLKEVALGLLFLASAFQLYYDINSRNMPWKYVLVYLVMSVPFYLMVFLPIVPVVEEQELERPGL